MKRLVFFVLVFLIMGALCFILLKTNNYAAFNAVYIISFLLLLLYTFVYSSGPAEKLIHTTVALVIMIAQIIMNMFVIQPYGDGAFSLYLLRMFGLVFIFIPLLTEQFFLKDRGIYPVMIDSENVTALTYSRFLRDKDEISENISKLKKAGEVISNGCVKEIITDAPRHSVHKYISCKSLSDEYFKKAQSAIDDGYIYLTLTRSRSPASEVIGVFTSKNYNHISIAFDSGLETIVSYNGGEKIAPPGLNPELIKQLTARSGSEILTYRLAATKRQKQIILDKVRTINEQGSAYNFLGMMLKLPSRPNIMFCSQFVYTMLKISGLNYFEKKPLQVKPTDFVELDYHRRLEFVEEISFK